MGKYNTIIANVMSFMKSRAILTAAELDLFTRIHQTPGTAKELAERTGLDERATTRILDCLITFSLLEKKTGYYFTTEEGSLLSYRHPETILPLVLHMNYLWHNWSNLTDIIRKGADPERRSNRKENAERNKAFIGAMHAIGQALSREIADTYDLSHFKRLLDVGGGSGIYTIAFLKKNPRMRAVLFDLENVIPMAEERLDAGGLKERVELAAGDFYQDELPRGCDLALLSAIIHQNSPKENVALFRKIYRALDQGGTLLIRDHIMDESRTRPPAGALFALNMVINTPGGDTYTFSEVKEGLEEAGFTDIRLVKVGETMDCLVEAKKLL